MLMMVKKVCLVVALAWGAATALYGLDSYPSTYYVQSYSITVNANNSAWNANSSLVIQPRGMGSDILVHVIGSGAPNIGDPGFGVRRSGELIIKTGNADGVANNYNATMVVGALNRTLGAQLTNDVLFAFDGNLTMSGTVSSVPTDNKYATIVIRSDLHTTDPKDRHQSLFYVGGVTNMADNSRLQVDGNHAYFEAGDGLLLYDRNVTLTGNDASTNIWLTNDGVLNVKGENGIQIARGGIRIGESSTSDNSGGDLRTTTMLIGDASTADHIGIVDVLKDGKLTASERVYVNNGELNLRDGSAIRLEKGLSVTDAMGTLNVAEDINLKTEQALDLYNGGVMNVTGAAKIGDKDPKVTKSETLLVNSSGKLNIAQTGFLQADRVVTSSDEYGKGATTVLGSVTAREFEVSDGALHINGGTVLADSFLLSGGEATVEGRLGTVDLGSGGPKIAVSGGIMNVNAGGVLTGTRVETTGGQLNLNTGSIVQTSTVHIGGESTANFHSGSKIVAGTELWAGGNSSMYIRGGSDIGENALGKFTVAGSAEVYLNEALSTDVLNFSGGRINLEQGGSLTINTPGSAYSFGGFLALGGGKLTMDRDLAFVGGGLGIDGTTAMAFDMEGFSLTIGANARIDAANATLTLENVGDFSLNGLYRVGSKDEKTLDMLIIESANPGASVFAVEAKTAQVELVGRAASMAHSAIDSGQGLLILKSDIQNGQTVSFLSDLGDFSYMFETRQDANGNWGLYVVNYSELSDDDKYGNLISIWRKKPEIGDNVHNVINHGFAQAVSDARKLQVSADYDALNQSGKFNADVLSSLSNPSSGAGYDALMLYNGSGLGMANQAVLSSNQQVLKSLGLRNTFLRREVAAVADSFDGSMRMPTYGLSAPGNRLWVTGRYANDRQYSDKGFEGYEYRAKSVLVGYDRLFGNSLAVGGAFGYTTGDFKDSAALADNSEIDTYSFNLYGVLSGESGLFLSGAIGYAYSDYEISDLRKLLGAEGWNRADYDSSSFLGAIAAGYDFQFSDSLSLTPSLGFSFVDVRAESHVQTFSANDNSVAGGTLSVGRVKNHSAAIPLELAVSYDFVNTPESLFSVDVKLGYAYELNNKGADGFIHYDGLNGIGPVKIVSNVPGRHLLNIGAGIKYVVGGLELGASYDYLRKNKYDAHVGSVSAGLSF